MSQKLLKDLLSEREQLVLKAIASGKTSQQIATELYISKHTVDTHRRKMIQKTEVQNTTALVQRAYLEGLFENSL